MFLFLSQVKHWIQSHSHERMQNKFVKKITSIFIFLCGGEQFLLKNNQLFIMKNKKEIFHFPQIQQFY